MATFPAVSAATDVASLIYARVSPLRHPVNNGTIFLTCIFLLQNAWRMSRRRRRDLLLSPPYLSRVAQQFAAVDDSFIAFQLLLRATIRDKHRRIGSLNR